MGIFQDAVKQKLRFATNQGLLSVEDLWDLPLATKKSGNSLNKIAILIHHALKEEEEISFVGDSVVQDTVMQLRFEIVKAVIADKKEENARRLILAEKAQKRKEIVNLIGAKKSEEMAGKSLAELTALLEAL